MRCMSGGVWVVMIAVCSIATARAAGVPGGDYEVRWQGAVEGQATIIFAERSGAVRVRVASGLRVVDKGEVVLRYAPSEDSTREERLAQQLLAATKELFELDVRAEESGSQDELIAIDRTKVILIAKRNAIKKAMDADKVRASVRGTPIIATSVRERRTVTEGEIVGVILPLGAHDLEDYEGWLSVIDKLKTDNDVEGILR